MSERQPKLSSNIIHDEEGRPIGIATNDGSLDYAGTTEDEKLEIKGDSDERKNP